VEPRCVYLTVLREPCWGAPMGCAEPSAEVLRSPRESAGGREGAPSEPPARQLGERSRTSGGGTARPLLLLWLASANEHRFGERAAGVGGDRVSPSLPSLVGASARGRGAMAVPPSLPSLVGASARGRGAMAVPRPEESSAIALSITAQREGMPAELGVAAELAVRRVGPPGDGTTLTAVLARLTVPATYAARHTEGG
jgi:hypothetical protein